MKNNTWSELTFVTKKVSYEKIDSSSYKSFTRTLRIFNDAKIKESDVVAVTIHAGFKNVLLNLFSPHNKEFKLTIDYVMAEKKYQTVFVVKIPNIEQE